MATSIDLNAGGSASFPFDTIGDSVTGRVTNLEELQQTDLNTGELKTFPNGEPMTMYRVELQTDLRADHEDDGVRSIYLKGSKKPDSQSSLAAVLGAVRQTTGRAALTVGGTLTMTYIGDGQAKQRGHNAPKLYSATYVAPSVDLGGTPQQAPQQQFQAPPAQPQQQVYQQPPAPAYPPQQAQYQAVPQQQAPPAQPQQQMVPQQPAPQQPTAAPPTQAPMTDPAAILAAMQAAGMDPAAFLGQQQ